MEDANGRLSLSEGFMEDVRRKNQESRIYVKQWMGSFGHKITWKHSIMPGTIGGISCYKSEDNRRFDEPH